MKKAAKREEKLRRQLPKMVLPEINLNDYSVLPPDENDEALEKDEGSDLGDLESDDEMDEGLSEGSALPLHVLPLYSLLPPHRQAKVFQTPPPGVRFCVVSTNVAETSVTIPNIKYVVDTGKVKSRFYDRITGVSAFHVTWTSQAAANQRAGRAGRIAPGHCYRLYSSAVFKDEFAEHSAPEISRRPIDELVLQMKSMHIDRVLNFPFPTPLDLDAAKAAESRLEILGALMETKNKKEKKDKGEAVKKVTELGLAMSSFPVAPRYGKMLALSHQHDILPYVICLVAAFTVQEVLVEGNEDVNMEQAKRNGRREKWRQMHKSWAGIGHSFALGDAAVLLGAICAAEAAGCTQEICKEYGLLWKAVKEIHKLRTQLTTDANLIMKSRRYIVNPGMDTPSQTQCKLLRQILISGLPDRVARKVSESEIKEGLDRTLWKRAYKVPDLEEPVFIHPSSVLSKSRPLPEYVVYQEIIQTSKMYMKCVTAIEPEWLPIFAAKLCTFSKPLDEPPPRFDKDSGTVRCYMNVSFGRSSWQLPPSEYEYPAGVDRFKWFARFLLEGEVAYELANYKEELLTPPVAMVKTWSKLQPRTEILLKELYRMQVDSAKILKEVWKRDKKYLLKAYLDWIPENYHEKLVNIWPPELGN